MPRPAQITIAVVLAFILIGIGAGGSASKKKATPVAAKAQATNTPITSTPAPTTSAPSTTSAPTTTTTRATTTTAPPPQPKMYAGSGDDVINITKPEPGKPALLHASHTGRRNFVVQARGTRTDLLVNTIGPYDGVRPLDFRQGQDSTSLEINADGAWTVELISLRQSPVAGTHQEGDGDTVFVPPPGRFDRVKILHTGAHNFVVTAYTTRSELMVNEIGHYDGRVRLPTGANLIEIEADGHWVVDFEA